jgi:FkbM family methyltransferase
MLLKILNLIEVTLAYLQGKGWGTWSYKKEFLSVSSLLSKSPSLCVDIGGNKGLYTEEILRNFPQCKVVIFEPSISNSNLLHSKFLDNANVTVEQKAVSNIDGEATLYSDSDGSGLASLTKRRLEHFDIAFEHSEKIAVIRFEDYWKRELGCANVDFVKLDIEGHELDALNGFGEALKFINVIQFEFGGCNIDTRTFWQDFWYFFKENNFDLYRITPFGKTKITKYRELDEFFSTTNFMAKRISA